MKQNIKSIGLLVILLLAAVGIGVIWSLFTTMVYEKEVWSIDLMFSKENIIKTSILAGIAIVVGIFWSGKQMK